MKSDLKISNGIGNILNQIVGDFQTNGVSLNETSQNEFNKLKSGLKSHLEVLNKVSVPDKIKIEFKKSILFYCISIPVIAVCMWFGISGYMQKNSIKVDGISFTPKEIQWFVDYEQYMSSKNKNTHESYIKDHPLP